MPWIADTALLLVVAATLAAWLVMVAWVMGNRLLHDARNRRMDSALEDLRQPALATLGREERMAAVYRILKGVPLRQLQSLMMSPVLPDWARDACSMQVERLLGPARLLATAHAGPARAGKWPWISALFVLARARHSERHALLQKALASGDVDVRNAAITLLGELGDDTAARVLVAGMQADRELGARIASQLDAFPHPAIAQLLALAASDDADARAWGAMLLWRHAHLPDVAERLLVLAGDPDPGVRKAALQSLNEAPSPRAAAVARARLDDPAAFVRAHAARTLARAAPTTCAIDLAPRLADPDWWVRQAARESLSRLDPDALAPVIELLDSPDRFARNGAADVLQASGSVSRLVAQERAGGPQAAPARALLDRIMRAGERQMIGGERHAHPSWQGAADPTAGRPNAEGTRLMALFNHLLAIGFWLSMAYFAASMLFAFFAMTVAWIENGRRERESRIEDFTTLRSSRFTLPVSIVSPVLNEEAMAVAATRSLLNQHYPEFEVIVVDDGSTDATLARLREAFDLEPVDVALRRQLPSADVTAIYRSRTEPRLSVISKRNAGTKADAVNSGVNLARYPYVCCVDGDTIYVANALLRSMSHVTVDPAHIVGATSFFGVGSEPERHAGLRRGWRTLDDSLLCTYQHLDLMRTFLSYRLAFSRLDCMLCNSGAFAIWRRDVLVELGGFSTAFTCEDIEMTFRVHEHSLRQRLGYRILSLPHMVAETEGPDSGKALVRQRARWQRVLMECVWHYRFMLLRPRYRNVGLLGLPYLWLFEALAPLMQLTALLTLACSIALGLLSWPAYLALLAAMLFVTVLPTTAAIGIQDHAYRDYRRGDLMRMMLLAPLDFLLYRPLIMLAGLRGYVDFLRGHKGWDKFDRNTRRADAAGGGHDGDAPRP